MVRTEEISIATPIGKTALELLRERNVALPSECGGTGTCGQCRVRVVEGKFNPVTNAERELISEAERNAGVRLACRLQGTGMVRIETLRASIKPLELSQIKRGKQRLRLGVAIDLGTTTLRLSLLDFAQASRLGSVQTLNAQAAFGADVMTRLAWAMQNETQRVELSEVIRRQLFEQIAALANTANVNPAEIERVVVVGNTAMIHLLLGIEIEPLALAPYRSLLDGQGRSKISPQDWNWPLAPEAACEVMPNVRSFVGSDLLADLIEADMDRDERMTLLLDLGTNGEVALGNRNRIWCSSTAAGCAFEATSLRCGVGARPGAVWRVWKEQNRFRFETLEGKNPIGFCGSGALSAIALLRQLGRIDASGHIQNDAPQYTFNGQARLRLLDPSEGNLEITQDDVRQIQLAKGAIAAATHILLEGARINASELKRVVLIGNFGRHLDVEAALTLGLLPSVSPPRVEVRHEATLLGAERALCAQKIRKRYEKLAQQIEWISLAEREDFTDRFAAAMALSPQEQHVPTN